MVDFAIARLGTVTTGLHELGEGDIVGVRGPFGNWFPMKKFKGKNLIILGGGIGGAPLRPVIQYVLDHRSDFGTLTILWAARTLTFWSLRMNTANGNLPPTLFCM